MQRYTSLLVSLAIHLAILLALALLTLAVRSTGAITIFASQAVGEPLEFEVVSLEMTDSDGSNYEDAISIASGPTAEVSLSDNPRLGFGGSGSGTIGGIPVYGSVTLVCDVSGSMKHDLAPLLEELSDKFPGSNVYLCIGCSMLGGSASLYRGSGHTKAWVSTSVPDFDKLKLNFHDTNGPSEAIQRAMNDSSAGVIFNCDLQDGISRDYVESVVARFRELGKPFSVRSLHRYAPSEFEKMLKSTGGIVRVEAIHRTPEPALPMVNNWVELQARQHALAQERHAKTMKLLEERREQMKISKERKRNEQDS